MLFNTLTFHPEVSHEHPSSTRDISLVFPRARVKIFQGPATKGRVIAKQGASVNTCEARLGRVSCRRSLPMAAGGLEAM